MSRVGSRQSQEKKQPKDLSQDLRTNGHPPPVWMLAIMWWWVGVVSVAMLMLPRRAHCTLLRIRQPWVVQLWGTSVLRLEVRRRWLARSQLTAGCRGQVSFARPGCRTQIASQEPQQSCSCSLIQIHAHLQEGREKWRAPSGIACRCMETEAKTQPKAKISISLDPPWEEEICWYCAQRLTACIVNRGHSTFSCCFSLIEG